MSNPKRLLFDENLIGECHTFYGNSGEIHLWFIHSRRLIKFHCLSQSARRFIIKHQIRRNLLHQIKTVFDGENGGKWNFFFPFSTQPEAELHSQKIYQSGRQRMDMKISTSSVEIQSLTEPNKFGASRRVKMERRDNDLSWGKLSDGDVTHISFSFLRSRIVHEGNSKVNSINQQVVHHTLDGTEIRSQTEW